MDACKQCAFIFYVRGKMEIAVNACLLTVRDMNIDAGQGYNLKWDGMDLLL